MMGCALFLLSFKKQVESTMENKFGEFQRYGSEVVGYCLHNSMNLLLGGIVLLFLV